MYVISHITFSYSPDEDRISLLSGCLSGQRICLWLTALLVRRLIPNLCELMSLHGVTQDLDEAASESNEDVARKTRNSEPDSTRPQDMPEFLVSAIDLAVTDVNFILTFRGKTPEEAAVFRVSLEASTKIVEALVACSEKAGWNCQTNRSEFGRTEHDLRKKITIH